MTGGRKMEIRKTTGITSKTQVAKRLSRTGQIPDKNDSSFAGKDAVSCLSAQPFPQKSRHPNGTENRRRFVF